MRNMSPKTFYFADDGSIPNSEFPLLIYKNAFLLRSGEGGSDKGLSEIWVKK